jgi:HAD superfamily hydrolase (TIGR01509 family)
MDGVIVDSTAMHVAAWERYLSDQGMSFADLGERMLGKHNDELVRDLFAGQELTEDLVSHHGASKEALYREMMSPVLDDKMVAGVAGFIRRYSHVPMAVATNAERRNVDFVLDKAGIRDAFRAVVSGHDVERPKPFPDIYLKAAELIGANPADCVVFEDSRTGVEAAHAAGMRVVALLTTLSSFDKVELSIHSFADPELEAWLSLICQCAS